MEKATAANLNYLTQGVTTVVTGNCGFGPVDVQEYFEKMEQLGQGCNVIHQVPHNAVRMQVMGNANRAPTRKSSGRWRSSWTRACEPGPGAWPPV